MANILVVEDLIGVRRAISSILSKYGHVISEAFDGRKALSCLKEKKYDLVITDILMPEMNGGELIAAIETMPDRPIILAISGGGAHLSAEDALHIAEQRADSMLAKPFENEELVQAVDALLTR